MRNIKLALLIAALSISGCGGGGDDNSSSTTQTITTPTPKPLADYVLNSDKLRQYELGDYVSYTFNFDETYSDGSGQYWNGGSLEWQIETDSNEWYDTDGSKTLISTYTVDIDGFVENQITERFIQSSRVDYPEVSGGYNLISDKDILVVDKSWDDNIYCIAYRIDENTCYPVPLSPSEFKVGYSWEFAGKSNRGLSLITMDPKGLYDSIVKWEVEKKEVIETELGSFETYKLKMYRELSTQTTTSRVYYVTEGYYWYYPRIGVVKADIVKSQRFSGNSTPYQKNEIDYTINYTNIPI
ncbi:hypothetical protein [Shewanella sp. T24-MNA-CIBAN-0130]|uniref:hypothetical protein n=1 Tax=Shewanella sp. T24-MNA-CIBAN-0130 TaxID=3140470 RepID=UPI00331C4E41